jgi:membrane protease YdiL (CAAX protease family)
MTDIGDRPETSPSVVGPAYGVTAPPPEHPELPDGVEVGGGRPRWRPWMAPVSLIMGFGLAMFGYVVVAGIGTGFGSDFEDPSPGVTIGATVVQNICLIGAAWFLAAKVAPPRPWQFGLRRSVRLGPTIGWSVLAWGSFIALSAIWVAALGLEDEEDTLPAELGVDESTFALLSVAFLVTVVAPIGEEIFFRGFFFRAVANWRGIWPAAIITGVVFGAIHAGGSPVGFLVPLAIFGVVLCLLYVKTKSLWPPIVLHCLNNSVAFGATQDWDWQIPVTAASALAFIALFGLAVRAVAGPAPARPSPV